MARRDQRRDNNYLDLVPTRTIDYEQQKDGKLVLLRPKWTRGLLSKLLQPRIRHKHFRVHLDEIGTVTWEAIDGRRTVGEISDLLHERFGDRVEPRYERCSRFIEQLHRGDMVDLSRPHETSAE
jgi:hypothetical protein